MSHDDAGPTKDRVLAAASELFAARGFHGTKARDIAARAGVNLAASHYHYGSKKDLYLEVLRAQFAAIRRTLAARGAAPSPEELDRLEHDELAALLHKRIKVILDMLLGPPPGVHGSLMQWEMTDPTEALPFIVNEFILPMRRAMEQIVARLEPNLDARTVERCVYSIFAQAVFYRSAMPALLMILDRPDYPRGITGPLTEHITQFSLGGLDHLARLGRKRRR